MIIKSAEFLISAAAAGQFPTSFLPEVAFAGKSNVGKSSLINSLLNRKHLVKTSSQPGKTRQINFFLINELWHFVDLPGYGFAKAPRAVQAQWEGLVSANLSDRSALKGVVVIVDIRHAPSPLDVQMKAWLDAAQLPALYVANKSDKLKRGQIAGHLKKIINTLALDEPPLVFSAQKGDGRDELWRKIESWL